MLKKIWIYFALLAVYLMIVSPSIPLKIEPLKPYLNGVFSATAPGEVGSWDVEDAYPNLGIASPLRILPMPNTSDYLVLSKVGEIWQVSFKNKTKNLVLDIKDRSFKLGEAGTVGMALHPKFGKADESGQFVFVFYRAKPAPDEWSELGFNRLSKFNWNTKTKKFDADTEEILIQQYDRSSWHNGGGMFFGPDGFLYLAVGDEGDEEFQVVSTQRLDGGFFSGLLRIDVDKDATRSHPIIRQPKPNEAAPSGWGKTFSQGYYIPNDNPWLDSEGQHLEEFYAIGLRSPYSTNYDTIENKIWVLDVGSNVREEINIVKRADNLQWPFVEGTVDSEVHAKPAEIIGSERFPIFEYKRSVGTAIIGGGVYRGSIFLNIYGKYIFSDHTQNKLMALSYNQAYDIYESETLIPNLENLDIDLPTKPGITGVHFLNDGSILLTVLGEDHLKPGRILRLKQNNIIPDPPALLSDLGAFKNLNTLEVIDGIIPYKVNAPLWSDRAIKKRWMAIPDGQQIQFDNSTSWVFPEGTVFIKHFELPITTNTNGATVKLETRFFIVGKNGAGYGLTYQWNEEETDAKLLRVLDSKEYNITENGQVVFKQKWDFPGRDQCMTCHNNNANYVLGVKTSQLNCNQLYADAPNEMNQLEYLSHTNRLNKTITDATNLNKMHALNDESVALELRIKSYLDSNCASCHRAGGVKDVDMDLRYELPLILQNTIKNKTLSQASNQNNFIIAPGDHSTSELWLRDSSTNENKMPPLSRNINDTTYLNKLATWIDGLTEESAVNQQFFIFPNPSKGLFSIRFEDDWSIPIDINIFSLNGALLYQQTTESLAAYLRLNNFAAGMYILKAQSNQNTLQQKMIIN